MESLFEIVDSVENVVKIQNDIHESNTISLDIESTGLDFKSDELLLIQFMVNGNIYLINNKSLPERVTRYILELLKGSQKPVIAHNAKFDVKFLYEKYGILFDNVYCTMIAEYLLTEAREKYNSLQDLVLKYEGIELDKKTVEKFIDAEEITEDMLIYGANDVKYLETIRQKQLEIIKEKNLEKTLALEFDVLPVVTDMESNGVLMDKESWLELYEEYSKKSKEYRKKIAKTVFTDFIENRSKDYKFENLKDVLDYYKITYKKTIKEKDYLKSIPFEDKETIEKEFVERFNVGSWRQLKTAFHRMGIGLESTAEKVLKSIKSESILAEHVLEFRHAYKRATTYGEDFLEHVREDGRIYAEFNQIGTATGRFSSNSPNLQNIIGGSRYRRCFIAPEGKKLITADYSQQEFRLAGELSGEEKIIEAYQKGKDMHTATASILFHIPLEKVTKDQRANGKTVNFAVLYGSSAWGLSRTMGITEEEAEALLERFKTGFPKLVKFQEMVNDMVWKKRYSVTPIGRRRGFDHKDSFDPPTEYFKFKGKLEREGFNHIIQGGSADMIKYALLMLYNDNPFGEKFSIIMTVHDEIVCEVDEEIAEEAKEFMLDRMIAAGELFMEHIPSKVDAVIADYWSK